MIDGVVTSDMVMSSGDFTGTGELTYEINVTTGGNAGYGEPFVKMREDSDSTWSPAFQVFGNTPLRVVDNDSVFEGVYVTFPGCQILTVGDIYKIDVIPDNNPMITFYNSTDYIGEMIIPDDGIIDVVSYWNGSYAFNETEGPVFAGVTLDLSGESPLTANTQITVDVEDADAMTYEYNVESEGWSSVIPFPEDFIVV
jgi:hypothetical protein